MCSRRGNKGVWTYKVLIVDIIKKYQPHIIKIFKFWKVTNSYII